ncbi:MAG: hypothetical protein SF002_06000 [Alphaproteobacteria bacterium]|nr:hypothetical protein [Alphaproteobacteria bacterium]
MTLPAGAAAAAIAGALQLFRYNANGLRPFVPTVDGFWHSFWAMALTAPLFILTMAVGQPSQRTPIDPAGLWAGLGMIFILLWLLFPLVMVRLAGMIGREDRVVGFLVVNNWISVPANLLQTAVAFASVLPLPAGVGEGLQMGVFLVLTVNRWWVTRLALGVTNLGAAGVVLLDLLLTVFVFQVVLTRLAD